MSKLFEPVAGEDGEMFYPVGYITRELLWSSWRDARKLSDDKMQSIAERYGDALLVSFHADDLLEDVLDEENVPHRHNENKKIARLREENNGELPKYAWPGGYPIFYVDAGNNVLCQPCAEKNDEYSAELVDYDVNYEDPALWCDNCGSSGCQGRIESAYAEDQVWCMCPTEGCGEEFYAEPDTEGMVECPKCKQGFKVEAKKEGTNVSND